jgi:hypothetical protein
MKLHFDPNQQYQIDAVASITNLFEGRPQSSPDYSVLVRILNKSGRLAELWINPQRFLDEVDEI